MPIAFQMPIVFKKAPALSGDIDPSKHVQPAQAALFSSPPAWLIIALLFGFHLMGNYLWWSYNDLTLHVDIARHLLHQQQFFAELVRISDDPGPWADALLSLFQDVDFHPKLTYVVASVWSFVIGHGPQAIRATNMTFLLLMLVSSYGLGATMFSKRVGLLSVAFVAFSPAVYGISRFFTLDFPHAALVTCALWQAFVLQKSPTTPRSIWYGIALGMGILSKAQFLFFLFAFALWNAWDLFFDKDHRNERLPRYVTAYGLAALISMPWWGGQLSYFWQLFTDRLGILGFESGPIAIDPGGGNHSGSSREFFSHNPSNYYLPPLSAANLACYPIYLWKYLSPPLCLLALCSLFALAKGKKRHLLVASCFVLILPLCLLTVMAWKSPRHAFPLVPYLVVLASQLLLGIPREKIRHCVITVLCGFFLLLYPVLSFVPPESATWDAVAPVRLLGYPSIPRGIQGSEDILGWVHAPSQDDNDCEEFFRFLSERIAVETKQHRGKPMLLFVSLQDVMERGAMFDFATMAAYWLGGTKELPEVRTNIVPHETLDAFALNKSRAFVLIQAAHWPTPQFARVPFQNFVDAEDEYPLADKERVLIAPSKDFRPWRVYINASLPPLPVPVNIFIYYPS